LRRLGAGATRWAQPRRALFGNGMSRSRKRTVLRSLDDWVRVRSDLTVRVHAALRDANIEIPFPQRDLHVRSVAPETLKGLPTE
jgi:small-conductance mechanosensitive channel